MSLSNESLTQNLRFSRTFTLKGLLWGEGDSKLLTKKSMTKNHFKGGFEEKVSDKMLQWKK